MTEYRRTPAVTATEGGGGGVVAQVVTAVSTVNDTNATTTRQNSSLVATITPLFADSVLLVEVDGDMEYTATASTERRRGWVTIRNETDAVDVIEQVRGGTLAAASALPVIQYAGIALKGRYTVNSTAARTFRLRHSAVDASVQSVVAGARTGGVLMTITEIAQ